jgi:hypothetical protein
MLSNLKRNILNIPGVTTNKKIISFESDDWGSIRMPSKEIFDKLQSHNFSPELDPYLMYDSLASATDMQALFDVLRSVKDKNHNHPIITANVVMGNPAFELIKKNNFQEYFWEPFTATWQRYPHCQNVEAMWKQGQKEKVIKFQCHGREHLNVDQWMKNLQKDNKLLKKAFDYKMISVSSKDSHLKFNFMEGLDFFSILEQQNKKLILEEALIEFENYFGFKSKSFIANCYIWDDFIEEILAENNVQFIQGISNQIMPILRKNKHYHKYVRHYFGEKNKFGQRYLIRNCFFEPSLNSKIDWVSDCLNRIKIAFKWGKPAIIGCHRLNFIGAIVEDNRAKNLISLKRLLKEITRIWPDVEFYSSDELFDRI